MRAWYESLVPREQLIVGLGAVALLLMLYFLMIWDPLVRSHQALSQDLSAQRELTVFMQQAALEARQLNRGGNASAKNANRSLLSTVDSSGKQAGMGDYIKRIQPEGEGTVRLWIEHAPFEVLAAWLQQLEKQYGITVDNGDLDKDAKAGSVKARLTVVRSAS